MSIETLDQKLRKRAEKKLDEELDRLFSPIFDQFRTDPTYAKVYGPNGKRDGEVEGCHAGEMECDDVLKKVKAALKEKKLEQRQNDETADFLSRVDNLQEEINDLRNDLTA